MKTINIEIALLDMCNRKTRAITVPNVSFGALRPSHEADILYLSAKGYAIEYEIKISKSDFMRDLVKPHRRKPHRQIKQLYYVVPQDMIDYCRQRLPEHTGLMGVKDYVYGGRTRYKVYEVVKAPINTTAVQWDLKDRLNLARLGTLRIEGLKRKALDYMDRAETLEKELERAYGEIEQLGNMVAF